MTAEARQAALWKLYDGVLQRLLAAIEGDGPVKASLLDVARRFLASNQITANARPDLRRGLEAVAAVRGVSLKANTQH